MNDEKLNKALSWLTVGLGCAAISVTCVFVAAVVASLFYGC